MHRESWKIGPIILLFLSFYYGNEIKKPYQIILIQNAHKLGTCGMDYMHELLLSLGFTKFIPVYKLATYILPASGKTTNFCL
jgi:hypothetical protein